jgi:hypothetical protein
MIFGRDSERFEITLAKWEHPTPPSAPGGDLLFNVSVAAGGYGAADQVWVARAAWAAFLAQFRELERRRSGAAELRGLLPEEFGLRFFTFDRAGHLGLEGHLAGRRYSMGTARELRLAFHLELDPSELGPALEQFESVASAA